MGLLLGLGVEFNVPGFTLSPILGAGLNGGEGGSVDSLVGSKLGGSVKENVAGMNTLNGISVTGVELGVLMTSVGVSVGAELGLLSKKETAGTGSSVRVGSLVGATVGGAVGFTVGDSVGDPVGFLVGPAVGTIVGVGAGLGLGESMGLLGVVSLLGEAVAVGFVVGPRLGHAVGALVLLGSAVVVGFSVGSAVLPVGVVVGAGVKVGTEDDPSSKPKGAIVGSSLLGESLVGALL